MEPPELSDGTVRLRALRDADIGTDGGGDPGGDTRGAAPGQRSVVAQCRDPESLRWTTVPRGYTAAMGAEFVAEAAAGWAGTGPYTLAVADAGDDSFLGSVDLRPRGAGRFSIGYGLGPWARGRGAATRAVGLLLGWAFAPVPHGLAAHSVEWRAFVGNWRSRRVAWKAGFRGFATVRDGSDQRGTPADDWVATVRADEAGTPAGRWLDVPELPVTARDGSRWVLRAWRDDAAEVAAVAAACSDPATQRWLAHLPHPYTAADARQFLATRPEEPATGTGIGWALAPVDGSAAGTGPAAASVGVFDLAAPYGSPTFGWWAHPAVRGRGLVSAAVRAASDWLLHDAPDGVRTHRVECAVDAGNDASARVALAAGFTEFGRGHAEDPDPAGGWSDCRYLERLRADALEQVARRPRPAG